MNIPKFDEFYNYIDIDHGVYIDEENGLFSYYSLHEYCIKYLNEEYTNVRLYELSKLLIDTGKLKHIKIKGHNNA